jgi:hypothetical protein
MSDLSFSFTDLGLVLSFHPPSPVQVNPTVLTLMTFPFLFAVMFGDVGHAIMMIMFAGFLILKEKQLAKQDLGDMVSMMFAGRWVLQVPGDTVAKKSSGHNVLVMWLHWLVQLCSISCRTQLKMCCLQ